MKQGSRGEERGGGVLTDAHRPIIQQATRKQTEYEFYFLISLVVK